MLLGLSALIWALKQIPIKLNPEQGALLKPVLDQGKKKKKRNRDLSFTELEKKQN